LAEQVDVPQALADLLFAGLDHGVDSARGGGQLTPFVVTQVAGQRSLARMMATTMTEARAEGVKLIRETTMAGDDCAVLVYDGYLETEGDGRFEAIFAKAVDSTGRVVTIAQRYRPKGFLRPWQPLGNPALLPHDGEDLRPPSESPAPTPGGGKGGGSGTRKARRKTPA
jgi:hypothetical protein